MSTILSIETPDELREMDAYLSRDSVRGRIVLSLIFAAAAPFGLLLAILGGSVIGVVVALAWFVLWTGWIVRIWYRLRDARPYRIPVRLGVQQIGEAHNLYRRLSDQSTHYALPLVLAMYPLSRVDAQGGTGQASVVALMQDRVNALRKLLDAEDEVRLSVADPLLLNRDDLIASQAYQDALAEVVELLGAS